MIILKNNLKRLLRDRFNLLVMIILPVVFIALFIFGGSNGMPVRIGIADNDGTFLTQHLMEGLKKNCIVISIKEDEIKKMLINDELEYAIKIDEGFTDGIISGKDASLKGYGLKNYNTSIPARLYINSFINSAKSIAEASRGDAASFEKGIEYYLEGNVSAAYKPIEEERFDKTKALQCINMIIMFMMYLSVNAASLIMEDKKFKTYERILTSPISMRKYMFGNILSFFAIIWLQIVVLFGLLMIVFRVDFGTLLPHVLLFALIYSVVSVSLGMAIVNQSKSLKQASSITPLIVVPISMLGGCFWPVWVMPDMLQKLSSFIPVTWAAQGMEKILSGGSIASVSHEIIILLLFSLVFFLLGSSKKRSFA